MTEKTTTQKPCPYCGSGFLVRTSAQIKGAEREAVQCGNCGALAARVIWSMRCDPDDPREKVREVMGHSKAVAARGLLDVAQAIDGAARR
jgi:predicted Zn finger-like uncharacterized protein